MKNREVFLRDPLAFELLNNGVSKVAEIGDNPGQLTTLRFELETFVCDGEYARGRTWTGSESRSSRPSGSAGSSAVGSRTW
jgi:hypothetical protein